eukprot:Lithocolla_globosa_v1_NODE_3754_length_1590_cov_33.272964.p3 type:complete len:110 gc:universal NODE_3754_length_1590_cov_33.272964:925-596(-)
MSYFMSSGSGMAAGMGFLPPKSSQNSMVGCWKPSKTEMVGFEPRSSSKFRTSSAAFAFSIIPADLPTHWYNFMPASKMKTSPSFMEETDRATSRTTAFFLPLMCKSRGL